jgi:hypothetical protein
VLGDSFAGLEARMDLRLGCATFVDIAISRWRDDFAECRVDGGDVVRLASSTPAASSRFVVQGATPTVGSGPLLALHHYPATGYRDVAQWLAYATADAVI